jgi:NADH-quinone oxidoreductase subunit M
MILVLLIVLLMAGGLLAWISGRWNNEAPRWVALMCLIVNFLITIFIWTKYHDSSLDGWIVQYNAPWIASFGVSFNLALDGLSLLMLVLTSFLGLVAVLTSWNEIQNKVGFFHFNLLWVLAGITGVFITLDLFLFYFFWEVMLIPMS